MGAWTFRQRHRELGVILDLTAGCQARWHLGNLVGAERACALEATDAVAAFADQQSICNDELVLMTVSIGAVMPQYYRRVSTGKRRAMQRSPR